MMKNKVLVELVVPVLEENYDVYLPINKKIGNIIELLNRALFFYNNSLTMKVKCFTILLDIYNI